MSNAWHINYGCLKSYTELYLRYCEKILSFNRFVIDWRIQRKRKIDNCDITNAIKSKPKSKQPKINEKMPSETEVKENIFLFVPNLIGEWTNNKTNNKTICYWIIFIRIPWWIEWCLCRHRVFSFFYYSCLCCLICSGSWISAYFEPYGRCKLDYRLTIVFNISGYARIFLAIIAFYFMQSHYVVAGWCYIVSALLDAFDGHAARAFNQSELKQNIYVDNWK